MQAKNRDLLSNTRCNRFLLAPVLAMMVFSSANAASPGAKASVSAALPYLQREGVAWMDKRGCVSCHQIPAMLWSLDAAAAHGFDVDATKLQEWKTWSTQPVNFVKPAEKKEDLDVAKTLASNIDTMSALLLAISPSAESEADADTQWRNQFVNALVANQRGDHSWKPCGQLPAQKRPGRETTQVTTMWTLIALGRNQGDAKSLKEALAFVDKGDDRISIEWWVARMLLAQQQGEPMDRYRDEIAQRQRDDGGWGWLNEDESDALATGMALYALSTSGHSKDDAIERATKWLVDTQKEDGSWAVPGTKKSTKDKPTPTANYWGTAWAVIGMLESGHAD